MWSLRPVNADGDDKPRNTLSSFAGITLVTVAVYTKAAGTNQYQENCVDWERPSGIGQGLLSQFSLAKEQIDWVDGRISHDGDGDGDDEDETSETD